jgi:hypothetical protein
VKRIFAACLFLLVLPASHAAEPEADAREPLSRTDVERAFILSQMRLVLATVQEITEGLAKNDLNAVATPPMAPISPSSMASITRN